MSEKIGSILETKASEALAKELLKELDEPDPNLAKAKELLDEDTEKYDRS